MTPELLVRLPDQPANEDLRGRRIEPFPRRPVRQPDRATNERCLVRPLLLLADQADAEWRVQGRLT